MKETVMVVCSYQRFKGGFENEIFPTNVCLIHTNFKVTDITFANPFMVMYPNIDKLAEEIAKHVKSLGYDITVTRDEFFESLRTAGILFLDTTNFTTSKYVLPCEVWD